MKTIKILALLSVALLLTGCEPPRGREIVDGSYSGLHIIIVEGCEYLESASPGQNRYAITHKGNCINPIHAHNKQIP